jgi:hypothetical protein
MRPWVMWVMAAAIAVGRGVIVRATRSGKPGLHGLEKSPQHLREV